MEARMYVGMVPVVEIIEEEYNLLLLFVLYKR